MALATTFSTDLLRFAAAGVINTGVTAVVYFAALHAVNPTIAYAISWAVGLAIVMVFYPNKVFPGGRQAMRDRLAVGGVLAIVFVFGSVLITILSRHLTIDGLAFAITLICTTAANFLLSRLILRR